MCDSARPRGGHDVHGTVFNPQAASDSVALWPLVEASALYGLTFLAGGW
jgi:hypothetical protein